MPSREPNLPSATVDVFDWNAGTWERGVPLAQAFPREDLRAVVAADLAFAGISFVGEGDPGEFVVWVAEQD